MKKIIYSILAILCSLTATMAFTACSNDDEPSASNDQNQVELLKELLYLDKDGQCPFATDQEGAYYLGVESPEDAAAIASILSLGASESGSMILPDNQGSIKVTTPADANGHYYDIIYNVTGIPVKKLCIVSTEWMENGSENLVVRREGNPTSGSRTIYFVCEKCGARYSFGNVPKACTYKNCGCTHFYRYTVSTGAGNSHVMI